MSGDARFLPAFLLAAAVVAAGRSHAADAAGRSPSPKTSYAIVVKHSTVKDVRWQKVVAALKDKHQASIITFDTSIDETLDALKRQHPRHTCFIAEPEDVSRAFVGQVHQLTRKLDDDPYTDTFWSID